MTKLLDLVPLVVVVVGAWAQVTPIQGTDTLTNSRPTINTNFNNLNPTVVRGDIPYRGVSGLTYIPLADGCLQKVGSDLAYAPCVPANTAAGAWGITIDGGGSPIASGVKGYGVIPYSCTIGSWSLVATPSGSITVDIWKAAGAVPTSANKITASASPALSSSQLLVNQTSLTGWTTAVAANDVVGFSVPSTATNITWAQLTVKCAKP